jgi:PAS domain S-box-containing protein
VTELKPLVLRPAGAAPCAWEDGLRAFHAARAFTPPIAAAELNEASCVLVDATIPAVLEEVRRLRRDDPTLQPVVIAAAGDRERIQRGLLFAPGVGELWIAAPDEVGPDLVARASEVTRQRRAHQRRSRQVEHALATLEPSPPRRAVLSDAYLAALLDAVPDPVLSVDAAGRVISVNPATERVLGRLRASMINLALEEVVSRVYGEMPDFAALQGTTAQVRSQIGFVRAGGEEGEGELVVVPVDAGGHRVYVVVLHDLSDERRTQHELEATAGELEAQAAELQEQTSALEAALASRERFYNSMSHELRTPVNAIIGYNSLLLENIYGPLSDPQQEALERAQKAASHLLELVGDVLDLAKIEAGRIELTPEKVSFPEVLHDLLVTVQPLAEERGSAVSIMGEGTHTLRTDPGRLRQILLNLLSNAAKFGEGNPIEIRWTPLHGGVSVDVVDHGRGIGEEDLPHLFSEFAQFGERQAGGTGLGLAISKRLADALGGALVAHSELGRGSTFSLRLPPDIPRHADTGRPLPT